LWGSNELFSALYSDLCVDILPAALIIEPAQDCWSLPWTCVEFSLQMLLRVIFYDCLGVDSTSKLKACFILWTILREVLQYFWPTSSSLGLVKLSIKQDFLKMSGFIEMFVRSIEVTDADWPEPSCFCSRSFLHKTLEILGSFWDDSFFLVVPQLMDEIETFGPFKFTFIVLTDSLGLCAGLIDFFKCFHFGFFNLQSLDSWILLLNEWINIYLSIWLSRRDFNYTGRLFLKKNVYSNQLSWITEI